MSALGIVLAVAGPGLWAAASGRLRARLAGFLADPAFGAGQQLLDIGVTPPRSSAIKISTRAVARPPVVDEELVHRARTRPTP